MRIYTFVIAGTFASPSSFRSASLSLVIPGPSALFADGTRLRLQDRKRERPRIKSGAGCGNPKGERQEWREPIQPLRSSGENRAGCAVHLQPAQPFTLRIPLDFALLSPTYALAAGMNPSL
ncbi:MAG TPA: hypothetical protein VJ823_09110 [Rhodanobacteraceae bacterium]|nr:hypothetical protein [Rhodanobacteraceae bacterium]